jgi:hypothetical protein
MRSPCAMRVPQVTAAEHLRRWPSCRSCPAASPRGRWGESQSTHGSWGATRARCGVRLRPRSRRSRSRRANEILKAASASFAQEWTRQGRSAGPRSATRSPTGPSGGGARTAATPTSSSARSSTRSGPAGSATGRSSTTRTGVRTTRRCALVSASMITARLPRRTGHQPPSDGVGKGQRRRGPGLHLDVPIHTTDTVLDQSRTDRQSTDRTRSRRYAGERRITRKGRPDRRARTIRRFLDNANPEDFDSA